MTKFNAKASFIKNNQELKFPRLPISIWYKHGPTCLVLPIDLTVHIDVELNPGPLQKKPIYLLACLPAISVISGLVSHTSDKLLYTSYADTRHVGFCGSYYSDVYHRFSYRTCSLPLSSTYRRCRAGRRVRERKARNTHRIESVVSYPRASRGSDNLHKGSNLNNLSVVTSLPRYLVTSTNSSFQTNLVVNPRSTFLNFAVFNSRSVRNNIESIIDHVVENDIGLCTVTETWLNNADSVSIAQVSVAGYFSKNFPRQSQNRGGGTGILFRDFVNVSLVDGKENKSFEYSEWIVKVYDRSMRHIIVYRPPYSSSRPVSTSVFFDEFSQVLKNVVMCPEVLVMSGDFNFHLDDLRVMTPRNLWIYWKRLVFRNTSPARPIYRVIPWILLLLVRQMMLFLLLLKLPFPSPIILLFSVLLASRDQLYHAKN